jgi:transposase InsO family protein
MSTIRHEASRARIRTAHHTHCMALRTMGTRSSRAFALLVTVDKFSKWTEAVPVTNQEATMAVKFFKPIIYRYGIPNNIITDNGTNFTSGEFQQFAKEFGIKIKYASVAHPKSNG